MGKHTYKRFTISPSLIQPQIYDIYYPSGGFLTTSPTMEDAKFQINWTIRIHGVTDFMDIYKTQLKQSVLSAPHEYAWGIEKLEEVCSRMREAFIRGTYNHDSPSIKKTCKILGIKHTKTAMENYFESK